MGALRLRSSGGKPSDAAAAGSTAREVAAAMSAV